MSHIGTNTIGKMFLGSTQIAKAYLGTQLVYQSGGPTPPVVTPVFYDYLYFDGAAYITTNFVLPANCSIRSIIGSETDKISQYVFGARDSSSGAYIAIIYGGSTSNTRRQVVPYYGKTSALATNRYLDWTYTSLGLFLTPSKFGWGTTSYSISKGNVQPDGYFNIGYTGAPTITLSHFTGRFATLYIYGSDASSVSTYAGFDNYTPVATFRPCTYNGVAGMWYVEGNTFFGNSAGSGTLTASNS